MGRFLMIKYINASLNNTFSFNKRKVPMLCAIQKSSWPYVESP